MLKFYCDVCGEHQHVVLEDIKRDELNPEPWGDIVCLECHLVIATASADVEGKIYFVPNEQANAQTPA